MHEKPRRNVRWPADPRLIVGCTTGLVDFTPARPRNSWVTQGFATLAAAAVIGVVAYLLWHL